jgi:tetratricopeptide (TPR) repeat protein
MSILESLTLNLLCSAQPQYTAPVRKAAGALVAAVLLCCIQQTVSAQTAHPAAAPATNTAATSNAIPTQQQLMAARALIKENPRDSKAHFELAELLRKSHRDREAAREYLETTRLDPTNYLAFHQLSIVDPQPAEIRQAVDQLTQLQQEKPKELMLRVALSELLEKEGNYYQAARVLVDLVYQNAVPERYRKKVDVRIHFLLAKSKDVHTREQEKNFVSEEELDSTPAPLPEASLHRDLTASKIHEPKSMRSVGHTPLLP